MKMATPYQGLSIEKHKDGSQIGTQGPSKIEKLVQLALTVTSIPVIIAAAVSIHNSNSLNNRVDELKYIQGEIKAQIQSNEAMFERYMALQKQLGIELPSSSILYYLVPVTVVDEERSY